MGDDRNTTPELAEAERRGFYSGLNVGLVSIGIVCAVGASIRSLYELPKYEFVYAQVKVPMPGLTLLVLWSYPFVVPILLLGTIVCVVATRRWADQRRTMVMNTVLLSLSVGWVALSVLAIQLPFLHMLEGIGRGAGR